jgi:hypothetical protein
LSIGELMRMQRPTVVLTSINARLLIALAAQRSGPVQAQTPHVPQCSAIEILDKGGQVRPALTIESSGEAVFRLCDAKGTFRVKISASSEGSGRLLLDGSTDSGLHMLSRRTGTLTLKGEGRPAASD